MSVAGLAAALSLLLPAAQIADPADTPAADSTITRIVVFPKHAEVTREIAVQAAAGDNSVVFRNLVPTLNPHTLRASVSDSARVTGTEIRTGYVESLNDEIGKLDAALVAQSDELAREARTEARLNEQAAFYRGVKERLTVDVGRELGAGGDGEVSVGDWRQVLDFVSAGLQECDTQLVELAARVRDQQARLAVLQKERADYAGRQPRDLKEVTVSFASDVAGPARVAVHYIVDTVAWQPSYDVHLDRERGEIEVIGYGQVVQWTGEHWTDVQLSLAMSRPDFELAIPELAPMQASLDDKEMAQLAKEVAFLGTSAADQAQKWSEARFKRSQERETFRRNLEQLSRRPEQHLQQYGLSQQIIAGAMSRVIDRFAGVRYDIPQRQSIPCDSSPHKVVAFAARMPAKLRYVATPALGSTIMLEGEIVNTSGFPFLEGGASLFIDGSYVGAGPVAGAAKNETLSFGFGPDDSLVVSRRLVAREVKGPEAFRQSQVITYRYEIAVENFNQRGAEVEVADQIPVSKTTDIQVKFLESSSAPQLEASMGALHWALQIGAGAKSLIAYAFSVECPVGRDVHWQ